MTLTLNQGEITLNEPDLIKWALQKRPKHEKHSSTGWKNKENHHIWKGEDTRWGAQQEGLLLLKALPQPQENKFCQLLNLEEDSDPQVRICPRANLVSGWWDTEQITWLTHTQSSDSWKLWGNKFFFFFFKPRLWQFVMQFYKMNMTFKNINKNCQWICLIEV